MDGSAIEKLITDISKLPGLGPKSAKRIVLKLINNREKLIKPLANTLAQVYKNIVRCNICGNIKSLNSTCINVSGIFSPSLSGHSTIVRKFS